MAYLLLLAIWLVLVMLIGLKGLAHAAHVAAVVPLGDELHLVFECAALALLL